MTLRRQMEAFLQEDEQRKASFGGLPQTSISPYEERLKYWQDKEHITGGPSNATDLFTHGLWNFADTLTFGVADWSGLDHLVWGGEYGEDIVADNIWAKIGSAVGTVGAFMVPKIGVVAAGKKMTMMAAKPFIKMAGAQTFKQATKKSSAEAAKAVKKATGVDDLFAVDKAGKFVNEAAATGGLFSNKLAGQLAGMQKTAKMNHSVAKSDDFLKFAEKNIDDLVKPYRNLGANPKQLEAVEAVANSYKKYFLGKIPDGAGGFTRNPNFVRPLQDFVDLIAIRGGKQAYGWGSMIEEAAMFTMIDGVHEIFRHMDEKRDYDWTAPMWGGITGSLFGALKFTNMPWGKPAGQDASAFADWKQGLMTALKSEKRIGKMSVPQVKMQAKWLGDDLVAEGRGGNFVNYNVKRADGTTKTVEFDLANVDNSMHSLLVESGKDNLERAAKENFEEIVLKDIFIKKMKQVGKDARSWALSADIKSSAENWRKMTLGTMFMNLHTVWDYTQGHPIGADDVAINVVLGAWLNRKGVGRQYDLTPKNFNSNINIMRKAMNNLGIKGQNVYRIPTFDPKQAPHASPINNDVKLKEIFKDFENRGNTDPMWEVATEPIQNWTGIQSVGGEINPANAKLNQKGSPYHGKTLDIDLFNEFYRDSYGATYKYLKNKDGIKLEDALHVQEGLKKIGIKNAQDYANYTDAVVTSKIDDFTYTVAKTAKELHEIEQGFIGSGEQRTTFSLKNASESSIGKVAKTITISADLKASAEAGQLKDILTGKLDSKTQIENVQKDINEVLRLSKDVMKAEDSGKRVYVTDPVQLESIVKVLESNRRILNDKMNVINPRFEFHWQHTYGVEGQVQSRLLSHVVTHISKTMDPTVNPEQWGTVRNLLIESKLLNNQGEFGNDKLIVDPGRIKFYGEGEFDVTTRAKAQSNRDFLNYVHKILQAKGQHNQDNITGAQGQPKVEIHFNQVEKLRNALSQLNIPVDSYSIKTMGHEISRRTSARISENSNLNSGDIDALMSVAVTPFEGKNYKGQMEAPEAKIVTPRRTANGVDGFAVSKVKVLEGNIREQELADRWNSKVDKWVDNGKGYVVKKELWTLIEGKDLEGLLKTVEKSNTALNLEAKKQMMLFLDGLDPQDPTKNQIMSYLSSTRGQKDASTIMKWMVDLGVIKKGVKNADGTVDSEKFLMDAKVFDDAKTRSIFKRRLENYGIDTESIELMYAKGANNIRVSLENRFGAKENKSIINEEAFFDTYFASPSQEMTHTKNYSFKEFEGGLKRQHLTSAESKKSYIHDKMFNNDGEFRGIKAVNEILSEITLPNNKTKQNAIDDITSVLSTRLQAKEIPVLSYVGGNITQNKASISNFKTSFDAAHESIVGHKMITFDGLAYDWGYDSSYRPHNKPVDIFNKGKNLTSYEVEKISQIRERVQKALDNHLVDTNQFSIKGGVLVALPKVGVIVDPNSYVRVRKQYKELREKYKDVLEKPENSVSKEKFDKMIKQLESVDKLGETWNNDYTLAYRDLLFEKMVYSSKNGKEVFLEYMNASVGSDKLANLTKRFSLFNDNSSKKHSPEIDDLILQNAESSTEKYRVGNKTFIKKGRKEIVEYYKNKKEDGQQVIDVATFEDTSSLNSSTSIKTEFNKKYKKKGYDWESQNGRNRPDESSHDSQSYINPRYAQYLGYHYGVDGAKVYKPVISSAGEGHYLLYGKTAFFVDPGMNKFFELNPDIDILMARSADKLKSHPKELLINATMQELTNFTGAQSIKIKSSKIGINKEYNDFIPSAQGPALWNNYMDMAESAKIFDILYGPRLNEGTKLLKDIMSSDLKQNYAMRNILGGQKDIDNIHQMSEKTDFLSDMLMHSNIAPFASPEMYDRNITMNVLKNKMIEPAKKPYSYITSGGTDHYFGARSPIMQPAAQVKKANDKFSTNNLEATLYNRKTGKVEQYGEVLLADNIKSQPIEIPGQMGKEYKTEVVDLKTNKIRSAKKILEELYIADGGKEFDKFWKKLVDSEQPLGDLYNAFKTYGGNHDLVVSSLRYPRTRPHDFTYLRIKEFLSPDYGNASVVNKYDVYNIFEGDYDIDTIDFYWMNPKVVREHVVKQQGKSYIPPNVKDIPMAFADIELGAANGKVGNDAWERVFSDARNMTSLVKNVQSTTAQVNHMQNFFPSETNNYGYKQSVVLRGKDKSKVVLDWDVAQWNQRLTLEGQVVLDASGKTPQFLNGSIFEWRPEFLFPKYANGEGSYSREHFLSPDGKTISDSKIETYLENVKSSAANPDIAHKRVRIFRKYNAEGKEIELSSIDKDILMFEMGQYSKYNLALTRDGIHTTGSGEKRIPNYKDYIDAYDSYASFLSNPEISIYQHLRNLPSKTGKGALDYNNKKYNIEKDFDIFSNYFNLTQEAKTKYKFGYAKDTGQKYVKDIEILPAWQKYWSVGKNNPIFDLEMKQAFKSRLDGETGSASERIVRKIAKEDPLDSNYKSVLTGKEYQQYEFVERMLLGEKVHDIEGLISVLPKEIKSIKHASDQVNKLDRTIAKVYGSGKSKKDKDNILNSLFEKRQNILDNPKFKKLAIEEYTKGRKKKKLAKIKSVLVSENVEYIDATIAEISVNWAIDNFKPTNGRGMYKVIGDIKKQLGKDYAMQNSLGGVGKYGDKTLESIDLRESRRNFGKTVEDIEVGWETSITTGVKEYGVGFLFHYMKPKIDMNPNEINIGIFNGKPITSAVMPEQKWDPATGKVQQQTYANHNKPHKRIKKYILKGAQGKIVNSSVDPQTFKDLYRQFAQVEYFWKQYFNGKIKDIDVSSEQGLVGMLLDPVIKGVGTPNLHPKLRQHLSGYNEIRWGREVNETNPFSMGRKYNSTLRFWRGIFEKSGKANEFDEFAKGFSYINQIKAESGYMDPMVHIAFMHQIKTKLGSDVVFDAFPGQIDINSGKVKPIYDVTTQRNPLFALMGSGEMNGASGNQITLGSGLSQYKKDGLRKLISQVQDMGNVSGERSFARFKQEAGTSIKKGQKDYEGKIC
tara:strand:+ start:3122 stop:12124 length:9003 start_codon:yes stop_codon:yes gene_type:complete